MVNVVGTLQPAGTVTLGGVEDDAAGVATGVVEGFAELVIELVAELDVGLVDEELVLDEIGVELDAGVEVEDTQPRS